MKKIGEKSSMEKKNNMTLGITLIILSAVCTSFGQLFWKISSINILYLLIGFFLYGIGAILMIVALKFGQLSVIQPLMCVSYVFALIIGYIFLGEVVSTMELIGIVIIIAGVISIARGGKNE